MDYSESDKVPKQVTYGIKRNIYSLKRIMVYLDVLSMLDLCLKYVTYGFTRTYLPNEAHNGLP